MDLNFYPQNKSLWTIKGEKMARYTGPSWKQSRRLKFSVLENGKELQKGIMLLVNMVKEEQNYQNMLFNYKKNKKFVLPMALVKTV